MRAAALLALLALGAGARTDGFAELLRRGEEKAKRADLAGAEADLRAALELRPRDFYGLCVLSQFLRERGKLAESLLFAERLTKVSEGIPESNRAEKWLQRAETLLKLGRYDEAAADVERALKDKSEDFPSLWLGAQIQARAGRPERGLSFAERMLAAAAGRAERAKALAQRGQLLEALGRAAEAEKELAAAVEADPREPAALEARMQNLRAAGRLEEAAALADRMIEASADEPIPQRAVRLEQRAQTRRLRGDAAGAEADLRAALALEPDSAPALRTLARVLMEGGRAEQALVPAGSLGGAEGELLRAEALLSLGRREEARKALDAALTMENRSAEALKLAARAAREAGEGERALALAARWHALSGAAEARVEKGLALLALGRRKEAERELEAAAAQAADRPGTKLERARLALEGGRVDEAQKLSDEAFAAAPGELSAARSLAQAFLLVGRPERALPLAERARDQPLRAEALEALGRVDEAVRALESAPGSRADRLRLSRLLARLDRKKAALEAADEAVALSETPEERAESQSWRAQRRALLGDAEGARRDHAEAEAALPGWHARRPGDGAAWAALLPPAEARARLSSWIAEAKEARARAALGAALAESLWSAGEPESAEKAMAAALSAHAESACVDAPLLASRGKAALEYFQSCLRRFPKEPGLLSDRGVILWLAKRETEALADFRAALAARPGHLPAALSLSAAMQSRNEAAEAGKVLRAALAAAAPNDPALDFARKEAARLSTP